MYKICVFAGTTEGREIVSFLSGQPVLVTACVATQYGGESLKPAHNLTVRSGRLEEKAMEEMLKSEHFDLVVDATHPYAEQATRSISEACDSSGTEYLRLLREESGGLAEAVYFDSIEDAAAYLDKTEGNIFLTTGSRDIRKYTRISGFSERVYARVLPSEESIEACRDAGVAPSRIIAMQGPFTEELNEALFRSVSARYVVTKDGGSAGGFAEKVSAAKKAGSVPVVIGRPSAVSGLGISEAVKYLWGKFGFSINKKVTVIGAGPGSPEYLVPKASEAIREADCIIGSKRLTDMYSCPGKAVFAAVSPDKIAEYIAQHSEFRSFAVLMSGDTSFFSGTKKLLPLLKIYDTEVIPGISSLSYICAKLGFSYEDVMAVSLHGRERNIEEDVCGHRLVFALTSGERGPGDLCKRLTDAGLGGVSVHIGERLGYPDESLFAGPAEEMSCRIFDPLSAVMIVNCAAGSGRRPEKCGIALSVPGLPDEAFARGGSEGKIVPMTKSEIRAVCISKLRPERNSTCWDVGAGTGSVSVEMALQASSGTVYAVERRKDAVKLIEENRRKFALENLEIIEGEAPGALEKLPAPTHVFIGGSSGNMKEIIECVLRKNPQARIAATAVTLETAGELTACMKKFGFGTAETVMVGVSKSREAGRYHLMTGLDPVYIFTMQGAEGR